MVSTIHHFYDKWKHNHNLVQYAQLQRADGTDIGQANIPRDSRREKKARIPDVEFESDRQTEHDMDELMTIVVYLMLREMKRRKAGKRAEGLGLVGDVLGMVGS